MEFVKINAGKFTMGSPEGEKFRDDNEMQVQVEITKDFELLKHPVTQIQWYLVMGNNPSCFCGSEAEHRPVEQISWHDAQRFIQKLNSMTGKNHRLPTEAEWEYACRAGTTTPFFWGDENPEDYAVFNAQKTARVMSKKPNPWGLYDMCGNVWEWVQDSYQRELLDGKDPIQKSGEKRVIRGGCWFSHKSHIGTLLRSANRNNYDTNMDDSLVGFRVVRHCQASHGKDATAQVNPISQKN